MPAVGWGITRLGGVSGRTRSQPQITESICRSKGGELHMLITYLQGLLAQVRREEGQTAVEYGLVIALIALVVVGLLATAMGGVIDNIVGQINAAL
jgi:Flp pilus assembly pilin Flp